MNIITEEAGARAYKAMILFALVFVSDPVVLWAAGCCMLLDPAHHSSRTY